MCQFVREITKGTIEPEMLTNESLNKIFAQFDINGDGGIDREEMLIFIRIVSGLWHKQKRMAAKNSICLNSDLFFL